MKIDSPTLTCEQIKDRLQAIVCSNEIRIDFKEIMSSVPSSTRGRFKGRLINRVVFSIKPMDGSNTYRKCTPGRKRSNGKHVLFRRLPTLCQKGYMAFFHDVLTWSTEEEILLSLNKKSYQHWGEFVDLIDKAETEFWCASDPATHDYAVEPKPGNQKYCICQNGGIPGQTGFCGEVQDFT